jgi:hypothetical protein
MSEMTLEEKKRLFSLFVNMTEDEKASSSSAKNVKKESIIIAERVKK